MSNCGTYWKALNEAELKLVALDSLLAEGKATIAKLRKPQEEFWLARDEYLRLCEEGIELKDGRHVWGPDFLAMKQLEAEKGTEIRKLERRIRRLDRHGRIVSLDLSEARLTSLKALGGLRLEELYLNRNKGLTNLAGLDSMKSLRMLSASGCDLRSLEPLRGLRLYGLNVSFNLNLKDLVGLEGMNTLGKVNALCCGLVTLQSLKGLRLRTLNVGGNNKDGGRKYGLKTLTGIEGMTTLRKLEAPASDLISLEALSGLSLEELNVGNNGRLTSLAGLEQMNSLKYLKAYSCGLATLKALRGLGLESLNVEGNISLRDLVGLEEMSTLKSLEANNCRLPANEVARWQTMFPFATLSGQGPRRK